MVQVRLGVLAGKGEEFQEVGVLEMAGGGAVIKTLSAVESFGGLSTARSKEAASNCRASSPDWPVILRGHVQVELAFLRPL